MNSINENTPITSVILPTYNEKENIEELIRQLLYHLGSEVELIVSDDNSPDLTWQLAEQMNIPQVKVLRRFHNKGVGPAIWDGIMKAKGKNIVWMDCDLTMPPSLVPQMVELLKEYDVVVGSRYAQGGADRRSFIRISTSRLINFIANIILNFKIKDYDSGFIAARREVFDHVSFHPKGHGEYCIEFLYKCTRKKYKIKEIGYIFTERKLGQSKTAQYIFSIITYGIHYIWRILQVKFSKA